MNDFDWDFDLVAQMTKLATPDNPNRAVLAHLRRGMDRPPDFILGRVGWLFRRVPDGSVESAVLAAALFAWVKGECEHTQGVNFGAAFGLRLTLEEKQRREKRFIDLLDTDMSELSYKLRQAITLIGKDRIGLDWILLIKHLVQWSHPDRRVREQWARGFWSAPVEEEVANTPIETTVS